MSDTDSQQPETHQGPTTGEGGSWLEPGAQNVMLVYILYLAGFVFGGIPSIVGLVFAYINRGRSESFIETHYTWAIRTFWIGLLYSIICVVLMVVGIGFLLMFAVAIWVIVRCVIGLQAINRREPIKNPKSWVI